MVSSKCFVPGCSTGYASDKKKRKAEGKKPLSLFSVPADQNKLQKWQNAILRSDRELTVKDKVCELHFKPDEICRYFINYMHDGTTLIIPKERIRLVEDAVPSIFPKLSSNLITNERRKENSTLEKLPLSKNDKKSKPPLKSITLSKSYKKRKPPLKRKQLSKNGKKRKLPLKRLPLFENDKKEKLSHEVMKLSENDKMEKLSHEVMPLSENDKMEKLSHEVMPLSENDKMEKLSHEVMPLSENDKKEEPSQEVRPLFENDKKEKLSQEVMTLPENVKKRKLSLKVIPLSKKIITEDIQIEKVFTISEEVPSFTFNDLLKNIFEVKKPNKFWSVSSHEDHVLCVKWDSKFTPERQIIIDANLGLKFKYCGFQATFMSDALVDSVESLSKIIEKVDKCEVCPGAVNKDKNCSLYMEREWGYGRPKKWCIKCRTNVSRMPQRNLTSNLNKS